MTGRRHRRVVRRSALETLPPAVREPDAVVVRDPVLPDRAAEDSAVAWGDGTDTNDARLRADVPPHW